MSLSAQSLSKTNLNCIQPSPTCDLVNDYLNFVITYFEVISSSAPHIYHSALPLSPQTSFVRNLYKSFARPLVRVVHGLPISWELVVATVFNPSLSVMAVWSPCSRFIAVARLSPLIELLDAVTFKRLNTFEAPKGVTQWLSFSPSNSLLTQVSDKWELTSWDLQTGGIASTIPSEPRTSRTKCLSSTYSVDGKMFAIVHRDDQNTTTTISTYDLCSGTHTYSHQVSEGHIVASIWTHGKYLRFATVKPGSISIWEAGFSSVHTLVEIKSLSAPDTVSCSEEYLFLPTCSQLAFTLQKAVLVWDAQNSKLLLNYMGSKRHTAMTFSSDGHFFVCGGIGLGSHLWKEYPTGYMLHQVFPNRLRETMTPSLSPNGKSIIMLRGRTVQLWHTTRIIPLSSVIPPPAHKQTAFILEFSPDKTLAAVAQLEDNTVTVLNLKSGNPQLTIDAGMKVLALRVTGSTTVVFGGKGGGEGSVVTWSLPAGDCALNTRVNINDSVQTTKLNYILRHHPPPIPSTSISPNLNHIAITWNFVGNSLTLSIYEVSTGRCFTTPADGARPWFTPDGCEVWCHEIISEGWAIIKDSESNLIKLEPLMPAAHPPGEFPWQSSCGYEITPNGWVLSPSKKPLSWLPHHWRSHGMDKKWSGQFLGLLQSDLPMAVILEFDK